MTAPLRFLTLAAILASVPAFAADNNSFAILSKGKQVGKASYTVDKVKEGWRVRSRFEVHLTAGDQNGPSNDSALDESGGKRGGGSSGMIEAQVTAEYKTTPEGDFLGGYLSDQTQTITSFTPDKSRTTVAVNLTQAGASSLPTMLPVPKPDFLLAPTFDPAGLQVLLTTAAAHPHEDKTYLLIVPGASNRQPPTLQYVALDPSHSEPAQGTLDGKPLTLKHYTLRFRSGDADLYTDDAGTLMQAELAKPAVTFTRAKFVLTK